MATRAAWGTSAVRFGHVLAAFAAKLHGHLALCTNAPLLPADALRSCEALLAAGTQSCASQSLATLKQVRLTALPVTPIVMPAVTP